MNKADRLDGSKEKRDHRRSLDEITFPFAKKRASSSLRRKQLSCQNKFFPLQRSVITTFLEQLGKIPAEERVYPGLKMVTIEEIMLRSGFSSLTVLPQGGVRHGILIRATFDKGTT